MATQKQIQAARSNVGKLLTKVVPAAVREWLMLKPPPTVAMNSAADAGPPVVHNP